MATALDIITGALRDIGILDAIEIPSDEDAAVGLTYLNDLLEAWSNEGLTVYTQSQNSLTLTGAASYTVGSGGTFNTTRPIFPESAFYSLSGVDYHVQIINLEQYNSIPYKAATGGIPEVIAFNTAVPLSTMYAYPVVSTGTLTLVSQNPLTSLAGYTTVLAYPNGYNRALRLSLAVELMPNYGVQNQQVMAMAEKAKKDIKRINYKPATLDNTLTVGYRHRYGNILNGAY